MLKTAYSVLTETALSLMFEKIWFRMNTAAGDIPVQIPVLRSNIKIFNPSCFNLLTLRTFLFSCKNKYEPSICLRS